MMIQTLRKTLAELISIEEKIKEWEYRAKREGINLPDPELLIKKLIAEHGNK